MHAFACIHHTHTHGGGALLQQMFPMNQNITHLITRENVPGYFCECNHSEGLTSLANTAQSRRNKRRLKTGSFRVWKRVHFCSQCSAILPAGVQYTTDGPAALHHMSASTGGI